MQLSGIAQVWFRDALQAFLLAFELFSSQDARGGRQHSHLARLQSRTLILGEKKREKDLTPRMVFSHGKAKER